MDSSTGCGANMVYPRKKVEVYRAVVFTALLFGFECWTLYKKHIK